MLDILFINGTYPNYKTSEMTKANIGIEGGVISYIGNEQPDAKEVIDVTGKVVSPGFIDCHMHEEDFINDGKRFYIANNMLEMGVTTALGGNCGISRQPLKVFKDVIAELGGSPINYMMLTGYNARREGDGVGSNEQTTEKQREKYIASMREDLAEGAFGVSLGVEYDPGISYQEMLDAAAASDDSNHLVTMHYRTATISNLDAVREMIMFSREIKQRFQLSHLSSCSAFGNMKGALELINAEIERDPTFNYDTYPYDALSTNIGAAAFDDGYFETWVKSYNDVLLPNAPYNGVRCNEEIFREARKNHPETIAVCFVMETDEIREAVANKYGMVASDGILKGGEGHPRAAGTFPRVLGKYVREDKALTLIDALRKMTKEPAGRMLLDKKGQIELGFDADITVFDPETIIDRATFSKLERPEGIEYVLIGGDMAIERGIPVNYRLGRFIPYRK